MDMDVSCQDLFRCEWVLDGLVGRIVRRCFEVDLLVLALDVGEELGAAVHLDEQTGKEEFRRGGFGDVEDLFQEVKGRKEGESVDVRGEGGKNVGGRRGRRLLQRRRHRERTVKGIQMKGERERERVSFVCRRKKTKERD